MDGSRQGTDQPPPPERDDLPTTPLSGEIVELGPSRDGSGWGPGPRFDDSDGIRGTLFGPRSVAGGRVQIYGCSPGCIVMSLAISLILSIVLTLLLNAIL
jgi:hypothetical protein